MIKYLYRCLMVITLIIFTNCSRRLDTMTIPSTQTMVDAHESSPITPTFTLTPPKSTQSATSTLEPTQTDIPPFTPTADPYEVYTVDYLSNRGYGEGIVSLEEVLAENSYFTRYLITYPSERLKIYGFMNVPKRADPPFPIVITLHGYIDPEIYTTLDYTTGYADALARVGILVIHPNLRGYPPSDSGENLFRVGMAEDVLNLINIIEKQAGQAGILEQADPDAIGIWGHSMGGGISLRVITISPKIKAAVLYGAMSGDERRNFEAIFRWSGGERGLEELAVPSEKLVNISPINYLDRIVAPVSIHHGESDTLIPIQWSIELCEELMSLGKTVECFNYPGQPHTFYGDGETLFNERVINFFTRNLTQH